jgi:energy-coupling factor transport system permease protein
MNMKNSNVINFREIMITVILAIIFGGVYVAWGLLYNVMDAALPGSTEIIYGMWFIASITTAYIVQKPGIALIAEVAAAFAEVIYGGQWGLMTLVSGVAQGLAAEIILAIVRYKKWNAGVLMLAGAASAAASLPIDYAQGYLGEVSTGILVLKIVLRVISGAILAGLVGKWLGDALAKTGVLNSYKLARKQAERPF